MSVIDADSLRHPCDIYIGRIQVCVCVRGGGGGQDHPTKRFSGTPKRYKEGKNAMFVCKNAVHSQVTF